MKLEEVEKKLPKECWSSEYTEDERIEEILNLLQQQREETEKALDYVSNKKFPQLIKNEGHNQAVKELNAKIKKVRGKK